MNPFVAGSLISAGSNILGGFFGSRSAKRSDQFQRNFVQIRAADARKAGIHPLAALGANGAYTPVGNPMGDALAQAGTDIAAGMNAKAQAQMYNKVAESEIALNQAQANAANAQAHTMIQNARRFATGGPGTVNYGDATTPPTDPTTLFRLPEELQGAVQPEEVALENTNRGKAVPWINELFRRNLLDKDTQKILLGLSPERQFDALRQILLAQFPEIKSDPDKARERHAWAVRMFRALTGRSPR